MCRVAQPAAVVGGWSGRVVPGPRSLGISMAAWLLAQSPVLPRHLFLETPAVGRARLRETQPPGPQVLNSSICHPGWPRSSQGLGPGSEEPAEPYSSSGASNFLGEGQMQLLKGCSPQATSHWSVLREPRVIPCPSPHLQRWDSPPGGPDLGVGHSPTQEPQMAAEPGPHGWSPLLSNGLWPKVVSLGAGSAVPGPESRTFQERGRVLWVDVLLANAFCC